jgi:hypothetical protein
MKLARAFLPSPRALGAGIAASVASALAVAGCFVGSEGLSPPTDGFYFPTGVAVSPGGRVLYVANSDFDLQYNGGTVQALDLGRVRGRALDLQAALNPGGASGSGDSSEGAVATLAEACGDLAPNAQPLLYPGPCGPLALDGRYLKRSAVIGAFASNVLLTHRPLSGPSASSDESAGARARLFVPVRGDPSVTFFNVADDRREAGEARCEGDACFALDCGAPSGQRCAAEHRIGEKPSLENRHLRLPLEPVGIAADPAGENIVVSHQTENAASLLVNRWDEARPTLEYTLGELADGPTELAAVPQPKLAEELKARSRDFNYQPAFLLTFVAGPQIDLLRCEEDLSATPKRPFLLRSSVAPIRLVANGNDSRGVVVDASERQACEASCGSDLECLARCAEIPLPAFVAHRYPSTLLIGEVRTTLVRRDGPADPNDAWASAYETLTIRDAVPLAAYPSRVALGDVIDPNGKRSRRVFAVAFDSGLVFSYDPEARRVDAVIRTGRGPHALDFDTCDPKTDGGCETCDPETGACRACDPDEEGCEAYSFMYLTHFTDSYIGVVDLDMRKPNTFGSMLITLGEPIPPRESQ